MWDALQRLLPCHLTLIEGPWHVLGSAVQLHELDAPLASVFTRRQRQRHTVRWTPDDRPQQIDSHTTRFTCHTKRVKAGPSFSAHSSHCGAINGRILGSPLVDPLVQTI